MRDKDTFDHPAQKAIFLQISNDQMSYFSIFHYHNRTCKSYIFYVLALLLLLCSLATFLVWLLVVSLVFPVYSIHPSIHPCRVRGLSGACHQRSTVSCFFYFLTAGPCFQSTTCFLFCNELSSINVYPLVSCVSDTTVTLPSIYLQVLAFHLYFSLDFEFCKILIFVILLSKQLFFFNQ